MLKEWSTYAVGEGNMGIVLNGSLTTLQVSEVSLFEDIRQCTIALWWTWAFALDGATFQVDASGVVYLCCGSE